jgi:hypothetical protein
VKIKRKNECFFRPKNRGKNDEKKCSKNRVKNRAKTTQNKRQKNEVKLTTK